MIVFCKERHPILPGADILQGLGRLRAAPHFVCVWGERGDQVLTRKRRQSRMNCKERCDVHREMSLEHIRETSLQRLLTSYCISIDKVTWIQCVCWIVGPFHQWQIWVTVVSIRVWFLTVQDSDHQIVTKISGCDLWLRWAQWGTRLRAPIGGRSSCHLIFNYLVFFSCTNVLSWQTSNK